jgi:hypothetical protein
MIHASLVGNDGLNLAPTGSFEQVLIPVPGFKQPHLGAGGAAQAVLQSAKVPYSPLLPDIFEQVKVSLSHAQLCAGGALLPFMTDLHVGAK